MRTTCGCRSICLLSTFCMHSSNHTPCHLPLLPPQADTWIKQIEKQLEVTEPVSDVKLQLTVDENAKPPPPPSPAISPDLKAMAAAGAAAAAAANKGMSSRSEPLPATLRASLSARERGSPPKPDGGEAAAPGPPPPMRRLSPSPSRMLRGSMSGRAADAAAAGPPPPAYISARDAMYAGLARHVQAKVISDNFYSMMSATLEAVRGAQQELTRLVEECKKDFEALLKWVAGLVYGGWAVLMLWDVGRGRNDSGLCSVVTSVSPSA
jgi:hypothetical protein